MSVAAASFMVFAASQIGTPGPANMALMATGAAHGFRQALPFMFGVAFGKQLIIWPIGFGLMELAQSVPGLFTALKIASAAYIIWLAWKVANLRLKTATQRAVPPSFAAGLAVHPLNPKAWAMITAGFTAFVAPGTPTFEATSVIAACLLVCQLALHPLWTFAGHKIAQSLAGTRAEAYVMWALAALTVASVLFVLFGGGQS